MPDKILRMARSDASTPRRPVMLAIAGDSAAGKTTLTKGLVEALGEDRCTSICADDYHAYDRVERKELPFTPLHPDCNYLDIMEQHLQLLAMGRPILKPVYNHATGTLDRPEYVAPKEFVIVEGPAPAVDQAQPRLLRRDGLPRPAGGDPAPVEGPARHRQARLHRRAGGGRPGDAASPSRRRTSARSGSTPTSSPASPPSRAATTRRARRCPRSCCCARRSSTRASRRCSPTTTARRCT